MGTFTYNHSFFEDQKGVSSNSARQVVPFVISLVHPSSVLDLGCGVGTWLAVFLEHKVEDVVGVDGDYVDPSEMMIPPSRFVAADLAHRVELGRQFDLVISLEVAEHLPASSSESFVETLTTHGKVVLFSAAVPGQGGTNHINEQWPAYWKRLFEAREYLLVDCLRDRFWNNQEIVSCYRQNMMLYVDRTRLAGDPKLLQEYDRGKDRPLAVVHPALFEAVLKRRPGLRELARGLPYAVSQTIRIRARRAAAVFLGRTQKVRVDRTGPPRPFG